ncbi:hypothetical protein R1sor_024918 [Riccia sorocarpa]|uniref:Uncharacterized protein n=1 Tax=Riccia sorocarpa TaxID=122646 RepID=A0ABD3GRT1_9MARC
MAIMAFEQGDAHLLLHIQSMFTIKTTSTCKLKDDIRAAVNWKDSASLGKSLSSHQMELLIAEARKRKDDEDLPPKQENHPPHADDLADTEQYDKEDDDPPEAVPSSEPAAHLIDDDNPNLQQPRAPGSPEDEEFDADELHDVMNLHDIV